MAVTIRDVAREAGTTISTVSKAMNNSYTISGEMTAHVKEAARRLGYQPNARAQSFARKANREVAFLTHLPRDIAFTNPHMFEILSGAESALSSKGYAIKLYGCSADTVCFLVKDIINGKLADGLLLHASILTRELSNLLSKTETSHIVIGKPNFNNSLCWIDNNNKLSGELAAKHFIKMKRHNIAFMGGPEEDKISSDRLDGIKIYLKKHDMHLPKTLIFQGESTVESGEHMANLFLKSAVKYGAVICANNVIAFGCLRFFQKAGINIPKDISLLTFDDYPLAQLTVPALTTISIDVFEMGVSASKILMNKIKNPEMQIQTFTTMPKLIVRQSSM